MKESVLGLKEKHNTTFKLSASTKNYFKNGQLNIIFDGFGI